MDPLKEILELYRELVEMKMDDIYAESFEPLEWKRVHPLPQKVEELKDPLPGDVVEVVPSPDMLEMVFIVLRRVRGFVEIVPLSRFWEMATPKDVLLKVSGETYIAQTSLSMDIVRQDFKRIFRDRKLFIIDRLKDRTLQKVRAVCDGEARGDGLVITDEKREFKKLEIKRWFPVFAEGIILYETSQELTDAMERLKEALPLAASEQEDVRGEKEGITWFYDETDEVLILLPAEELIGTAKRINLRVGGEVVNLYEGVLPPKVELPLKRSAYSRKILEENLFVEDIENA